MISVGAKNEIVLGGHLVERLLDPVEALQRLDPWHECATPSPLICRKATLAGGR